MFVSHARAFLILALLLPTVAQGEPPRARAEAHFAAAERAFRAGRYEAALDELRTSQTIDPRPEFLITFAQVYRALGRIDEAIEQCDRYLQSASDAQLIARVQKLSRELRRERDAEAATTDDADEPSPSPSPSEPAASSEAHAPPATPPPVAPTPPAPPTAGPPARALVTAPPPPRGKPRSVTLAVTLGVVGVVIGVAVGVGVGVGASDSTPTTKLGNVRFP